MPNRRSSNSITCRVSFGTTIQCPCQRRTNRRPGWTLIEMLVVITLIAMAVTMAMANFMGPLKHAQFDTAQNFVKQADHSVRRQCLKSHRAGFLLIDPEQNTITTRFDKTQKTWKFPNNVDLESWQDQVTDSSVDPTQIAFDSLGASRTYAVCISLSNQRKIWLVFFGRTGEILECKNETEVKAIFAAMQSVGTNAH